ncbi:MAG: type II toxin-antitoxin system HicA family toxin [Candidatus Kapabacteria bacterium]|nr:type II toxin-antitoxin system HicA family toxin [Candidatus Kapabacteria bacterium]
MGNFSNLSGERAVKIFLKFGYRIAHQTGSHIILNHKSLPTLSVPNHKELAPFLLRSLIKKSGIDIDEFLSHK